MRKKEKEKKYSQHFYNVRDANKKKKNYLSRKVRSPFREIKKEKKLLPKYYYRHYH